VGEFVGEEIVSARATNKTKPAAADRLAQKAKIPDNSGASTLPKWLRMLDSNQH
jgi:hypothetical protein